MYRCLPQSLGFIVCFVTLMGVFFCSDRAQAAESVVLKYSVLQEKVSVAELATFAKTGELSPALRAYLKMAGREPDELRRLLTQEIPVNGTFLYQVLNSPVGETLLDRVSEVVHTPTNSANRESLRGAIVSSALPDGKITLIETLQNYPTPDVYVEGDRLAEVVQNMMRVMGRLPKFPSNFPF